MADVTKILAGYKMYLAAAGALGLALYHFASGDYNAALEAVIAAVAIFGGRTALAVNHQEVVQTKNEVMSALKEVHAKVADVHATVASEARVVAAQLKKDESV